LFKITINYAIFFEFNYREIVNRKEREVFVISEKKSKKIK